MKPDTIKMMSIEDIQPYYNNPRRHDNISEVKESIRRVGFRGSIWVDSNNIIIAGHGRYMAAKELGMKEVPVSVMADLTDAEVKYLRIKDNRASEQSDWDYQAYQAELDELRDMDYDVSDIDYDLDVEVFDSEVEVIEDEAPEVSDKEPVVKIGEIWRCGKHVLLCGDATNEDEVRRLVKQGGGSSESGSD